jgi:hypothetical protein
MQIDDLQKTVKSLRESTKTADGRRQRSAPSADERKEGKKMKKGNQIN